MSLPKQKVINEEVGFMPQGGRKATGQAGGLGRRGLFLGKMRDSGCGPWTEGFALFLLEEVSVTVFHVLTFSPVTCLFLFPTCAHKAVCLGCRLGSNGRDKQPITSLSVVCQANCSYSLK